MTVGTVVWRSRSSWGRTQMDSRIWLKSQSHYWYNVSSCTASGDETFLRG